MSLLGVEFALSWSKCFHAWNSVVLNFRLCEIGTSEFHIMWNSVQLISHDAFKMPPILTLNFTWMQNSVCPISHHVKFSAVLSPVHGTCFPICVCFHNCHSLALLDCCGRILDGPCFGELKRKSYLHTFRHILDHFQNSPKVETCGWVLSKKVQKVITFVCLSQEEGGWLVVFLFFFMLPRSCVRYEYSTVESP